ncbi:hypothetical protein KCU64_g1717, partial [Aureobasidium melanogenum]
MSIDPKTNDRVPGGRWLAAPARESGIYALAMSMATNANGVRLRDWSPGTPESCYYNALKALIAHHSLKCSNGPEDKALSNIDITSIVHIWRAAYGGKHPPYINDNDYMILANAVNKTVKELMIRRVNNLWEACCHFKAATSSTTSPFQTLSPEPRLKLDFLTSKVLDQTENATRTATTTGDSTIGRSGTFTPVDSTRNTLNSTLETLSSGIKELTLAIQKRSESEKSLCTAMDKLTAFLEKATQAHTSFDSVMHNRTPETSSEDGSVTSSP